MLTKKHTSAPKGKGATKKVQMANQKPVPKVAGTTPVKHLKPGFAVMMAAAKAKKASQGKVSAEQVKKQETVTRGKSAVQAKPVKKDKYQADFFVPASKTGKNPVKSKVATEQNRRSGKFGTAQRGKNVARKHTTKGVSNA